MLAHARCDLDRARTRCDNDVEALDSGGRAIDLRARPSLRV
jgi:hypothetical protein